MYTTIGMEGARGPGHVYIFVELVQLRLSKLAFTISFPFMPTM